MFLHIDCGNPSPFFTVSRYLGVAILFLSGCMLTTDQIRGLKPSSITTRVKTSANDPVEEDLLGRVRFQSPEFHQEVDEQSRRLDDELPPLPESRQVASHFDDLAAPEISPSGPPAAVSIPRSNNASGRNGTADGQFPPGLSSISRNRLANRTSTGSTSNLRNGTGGNGNSGSGSMSPRLRNRLEESTGGNDDAQFNYPDIDADPAKIYLDRFGVEGESDPFLFPWLVNLIFEDRWLLAEQDPDQALKNQLKRRLKIDIRDPDPDTANFPNGAYTLPKGRLYIENSPLGLYGASRSGNQPGLYQWEYLIRYGLTDNLEFRVFSNGLSVQAGQADQSGVTGFQPLAFESAAWNRL